MENRMSRSGLRNTLLARINRQPVWLRLVIWLCIGFLLLNTVVSVLLIVLGQAGGFLKFGLSLVCLIGFFFLGGKNILRTWVNSSKADFQRREEPVRGGYVYTVRPARATRLPLIVLLPLVLLLVGLMVSMGMQGNTAINIAVFIYIGVVSIFVLPGARYRRKVEISVGPHGIHSEGLVIPIERIAEIATSYDGIKLAEAPVMGPNGIPTSTLIGRGMGNRQAARSFVVTVRADGEAHASILAGGLTQDCATNLAMDISRVLDRVEQTSSV
jgi:hypothetical protein